MDDGTLAGTAAPTEYVDPVSLVYSTLDVERQIFYGERHASTCASASNSGGSFAGDPTLMGIYVSYDEAAQPVLTPPPGSGLIRFGMSS